MQDSVFISSVIEGFEGERKAVRDAVASLGLTPKMAEYDFGSLNDSPRAACLNGVRVADIYIMIAGDRYGYITPAGKSVTEEEFEEARKLQKPIYVIVKKPCEFEPRQKAFVSKISDYATGYVYGIFNDFTSLTNAVVKAISNHRKSEPPVRGLADVAQELGQKLASLREGFDRTPSVELAAIPEKCDKEILLARLGEEEVRQKFQQFLLFGETSLFGTKTGIDSRDLPDRLQIVPADLARRLPDQANLYTDCSLAVRLQLIDPAEKSNIVMGAAISGDYLRRCIGNFMRLFGAMWKYLYQSEQSPSFFFQGSVSFCGYMVFRQSSKNTDGVITLPSSPRDDSLLFPSSPCRVTGNRDAVIGECIEFLRRNLSS